jgi:oxalate decarboxylase
MFKSPRFEDVSLNQWLALTPQELVEASLRIDEKTVRALHKKKSPVVPA